MITNESMQQMLASAKPYCNFIFKAGPQRDLPDAEQLQWEHLRYMFQLRAAGILAIVFAVMDETEVMGIGILNTHDIEEARSVLDEDPNVRAGRLVYEIHPGLSFPGDVLL